MIIMDIKLDKNLNPEYEYVRGNMLSLPFKDGVFDAITAMASLHHVHDNIDSVLVDISRVLSKGGSILLAEPGSRNIPAKIARRAALTNLHDQTEKPFEPRKLLESVRKMFCVEQIGYYFYFSYLMPHVVGRVPPSIKGPARSFTQFLYAFDCKLLGKLPKLKNQSAYILILALKKTNTVSDDGIDAKS